MATLGATIFLFLLFKHCIIDLYLQSLIHFRTRKSDYFSMSAQIHYAEHGVGTFFVLCFFIPWPMAFVFGLIDYLAHWHIDFFKSKTQKRLGIVAPSRGYWFLSSIDQAGHYLTYYLIVLLIS